MALEALAVVPSPEAGRVRAGATAAPLDAAFAGENNPHSNPPPAWGRGKSCVLSQMRLSCSDTGKGMLLLDCPEFGIGRFRIGWRFGIGSGRFRLFRWLRPLGPIVLAAMTRLGPAVAAGCAGGGGE
jgi:hypothetical protein